MTADFTAATHAAYARWAPRYPPTPHNPLMRVEQQAMSEHWPNVAGRHALDLASGTGRYSHLLAQSSAAFIAALDFCLPMLSQLATASCVCGTMMSLPFRNDSFDAVISGLAVAHATDLGPWMLEVARVLRPGGTLLYSDFHPEAAHAKLTRSFKDDENLTWVVPHRTYELHAHHEAAAAAAMHIEVIRELRVGMELKERFAKSEDFYERWHGLPIVLVIRAKKCRA